MVETIGSQNDEICIVDFCPKKTEYSYFPSHMSVHYFISVCTSYHSFENWLVKELQLSHTSRQSFHTSQNMYLVLLSYTCLYFLTVFQGLFSKTIITLLYVVLSVAPSQYCASRYYHVVLPPLSCCTSLHHNIVLFSFIMLYFASWLIFYTLHVLFSLIFSYFPIYD
jgi:hypothetical protein